MTEDKNPYALEQLVEKFSEHAVKAKKMNQQLIEQFKEMNPDQSLPDHFKDDFNLPKALATMCAEILRLKGRQ